MPIRKRRISIFAGARAAVAGGIGLVILCVVFSLGTWYVARAAFRAHYAQLAPESTICEDQYTIRESRPGDPCLLTDGPNGRLFLIGDSHANQWSPPIVAWAKERGIRVVERAFGGCNVVAASVADDRQQPAYPMRDPKKCIAFSRRVMKEIRDSAATGPTAVVVSANWSGHVDPSRDNFAFRADLEAGLRSLVEASTRVVVIGVSPTFRHSVPACIARRSAPACRLPRADYDVATKAAKDVLAAALAQQPAFRLWDVTPIFCDSDWCYGAREGMLLFLDEHHVTRSAAMSAVKELTPSLDWLLNRK